MNHLWPTVDAGQLFDNLTHAAPRVCPSFFRYYLLAVFLRVSGSFWLFPPTADKWEFNNSLELAKPKSGAAEQISGLVWFAALLETRPAKWKSRRCPKIFIPKYIFTLLTECDSIHFCSPFFAQSGWLFLWALKYLGFLLSPHWGSPFPFCVWGPKRGIFSTFPAASWAGCSCYSPLCCCWFSLQLFHHSSPTFPSHKARKLLNGASFSPRTEWLILAVFPWPVTYKCTFQPVL